MGLDQDLFITKHFVWAHDHPHPTTVDGFELDSHKMTVVEWRKNHWVHQWFCANVSEAANECLEINVEVEGLAQLADKPEAWSDDPEALPPVSDEVRGSFFGVRVTDPEYEECRDGYRAEAKDEAKKIRQAIEWLKVDCGFNNCRQMEWQHRYATYRASW